MLRKSIIAALGMFAVVSSSVGAYFDTGLVEFRQGPPSNTVFTARHLCDEFESWYRTADGYTFVAIETFAVADR